MAVNFLFAEPGGRGFLRDAQSLAVLRHFNVLVIYLRNFFGRETRSLATASPLLLALCQSVESMDVLFLYFYFM